MQDRPTMKELLEAVQGYFQTSIAPLITDPRTRFQGLIAMNVLEILKREIESGEATSREEWRGIIALLGTSEPEPETVQDMEKALVRLNAEFARRARAGEYDSGETRKHAFDYARSVVTGKLKISNPGYLKEPSPEGL